MSSSLSLFFRAVLAVLLMIAFYALAIGLVAALLYIPYAEWKHLGRIHRRTGVACIVGAGVIIYALFPRRDRFVAPGPLLTAKEHPELFDVIARVAADMGQRMPAEVYLVSDLTAGVAQRGGIMGLGSRRVMFIGLALLRVLNVSEFRSVLAHEFGHFHGGDIMLGPWVYKTRAAVERMLSTLEDNLPEKKNRVYTMLVLLQKPFRFYAWGFLRITRAIARREVLAADRLSAEVAGADMRVDSLRLTYCCDLVFDEYWSNEATPPVSIGYRPPLAEGFRRFMAAPAVARRAARLLKMEMDEPSADPPHTHPPLRRRIAAVEQVPEKAIPLDERPAIALLNDVDEMEVRLIGHLLADEEAARELTPVSWDEVGEKAWIPIWGERVEPYRDALAGATPATILELFRDLDAFATRLRQCDRQHLPDEVRLDQAVSLLGTAVSLALREKGCRVSMLPGEDVVFERDGESIKPFALLDQLADNALTGDTWRQQCRAFGIADVPLGAVSAVRREIVFP